MASPSTDGQVTLSGLAGDEGACTSRIFPADAFVTCGLVGITMSHLLFVYGTLRRRSQHPMARRLAELARYVGPARIAGRLFDLGRYPGLQEPISPADWVHGDVYDLGEQIEQTLREMDAYENGESPQPAFFDRQRATVVLENGSDAEVWVYWFRGEVHEDRRIASGSYEQNCDPAG